MNKAKRAGAMVLATECLTSKCETLSPKPSTTKKEKKKHGPLLLARLFSSISLQFSVLGRQMEASITYLGSGGRKRQLLSF
jgi:hypothetical protein